MAHGFNFADEIDFWEAKAHFPSIGMVDGEPAFGLLDDVVEFGLGERFDVVVFEDLIVEVFGEASEEIHLLLN